MASEEPHPNILCETELIPMGGVWRDNGTIVFARSVVGQLYPVSASGGHPTPLTRLDSGRGETSHRFPVALPGDGGTSIAIVQNWQALPRK